MIQTPNQETPQQVVIPPSQEVVVANQVNPAPAVVGIQQLPQLQPPQQTVDRNVATIFQMLLIQHLLITYLL